MKHLYLVGLLTFFSCDSMAQTFQKSLEPGGNVPVTTIPDYNPGYSVYSNYENRLCNYEAPLMNSMLDMYECTGNAAFLDCFMVHAYNVLERRDDILQLDPNIPVSGLDPGIVKPFSGQMEWSFLLSGNGNNWNPEIVTQGIITLPMARFAYMIKVKYPTLQTRLAPASITGWDATGWYYIDDFADCAEFLKAKVNQTAHDFANSLFWSGSYQAYDNSGTPREASPNYISALGRVHTYMYKIYEYEGTTALKNDYLDKIRIIGSRLVNPSKTGYNRDWANDLISWKYGDPLDQTKFEDISHAILVMEFADLCNLFGITDINGNLLFDNGLMADLANTFKTKLIKSPLKYSMSITGNDGDATQVTNPAEGTVGRYDQYMNAGRYAFLARHIPDIYNMIADYFYEFGLYGPGTYPMYINEKGGQCNGISAVAMLARGRKGYAPIFQNYLDIKSVKRPSTYQSGSDLVGTEKWAGVVSGKFDATKTAHSIASFNSVTGRIEIREFDVQKKISNVVSSWNVPVHTTMPIWGSVTSGDIITGNNCDEIVAFNKVNNYFYMFKQNGAAITLVATFSVGKNCAGIAAGNFNTTAGDEIVFLSKDDGRMYLYNYTGTSFGSLAISNNATAAYVVSNPAGITVGNLDNNSANGLEIATINNNAGTDYNIKVYNLNATTLAFGPTVYQYAGTTGSYSQWDAITTGDFNADGYDELMLHRQYDGDFHIQYLDGGIIKSLCKENFTTSWTLGFFCGVKFSGDNKEHLMSLRNTDGHMFLFKATDLPGIPSRPIIPEGPGDPSGLQTAPEGAISPEGLALESDLLNLGEMDLENEIQIYPNPSNGVFVIESAKASLSQVTIMSAMGTQVYQSKKESIGNRLKIDLSEQPSGVYLIQVAIDGKSTFKRIVKN